MQSTVSKINGYIDLLRLTLREASASNESVAKACLYLVWLLTAGRFSVRELRAYGQHLREYRSLFPVLISKERTLGMLARMNPRDLAWKTEDKHLFYAHCEERGLPIPRHLFTSESEDKRYDDWLALSDEDAIACLPEQFIIKPRHGAYGRGFKAFQQKDGQLFDSDGTPVSLAGFRDAISESNQQMIVQERVYDHPSLGELSGMHALQTVRYVTYKDGERAPRPMFFALYLLRKGNIVSNFAFGVTGNCVAYGDTETGVLAGAVVGRPNRLGVETTTHHPSSGEEIKGFQLPYWDQVKELTAKAHESLNDFTAIGWDIALTPDGPMILEGNVWFDPPFYAPWIMQSSDWHRLYT